MKVFFSFLILIFIIFYSNVDVCVPMWVYVCEHRYPRVPEALDPPELGLPGVGTGNRTQILWKSTKCSLLLGHLFSLGKFILNNEILFPEESQELSVVN